MKIHVFDASAVARIFLSSGDLPPLESPKIAPAFLSVEFGNVLWKYLQKGYLHPDEANEIWNRFEKLGIEFREDLPLVPEAIKIGHESGLTVYDSLYATLARNENAVLVTADKKLSEIASSRGIEVMFLKSSQK